MLVTFPGATLPQSVEFLFGTLKDVVADFEDRSFVFQVLENLSIHLKRHLEDFTQYWVQARVEDSRLILGQILLKDRAIVDCEFPLELQVFLED